jgi:hypothetical protein
VLLSTVMMEIADSLVHNVLLILAPVASEYALTEPAHSQAVAPQSLVHQMLLTNATMILAVAILAIVQLPLLVLRVLLFFALMALASKIECSAKPSNLATHPHQ